MSEFWSGDLGLTLVTLSLILLIFVITPLREAGLPGRFNGAVRELLSPRWEVRGAAVVISGLPARVS